MNYFFLFYNYCFCRHTIAINVAVWRCGGVADEGERVEFLSCPSNINKSIIFSL